MVLGFEQATKYTVHDQDGNVVALMAEDRGGIGTEVARQVLRTRRKCCWYTRIERHRWCSL